MNIQQGVTSIGNYAFQECTALTTVTIPENFTFQDKYNELDINDCIYVEAECIRIYPIKRNGNNYTFDIKGIDVLKIHSIHPGKSWVPYSQQITLSNLTFHR